MLLPAASWPLTGPGKRKNSSMNATIHLEPITFHDSLPTVLGCWRTRLLIALVLYSLALCSTLQAVTPAPDGGYANGNTAEGSNALFSLTTGTKNTADGYLALYFNTSGYYNTAIGSEALYSNTTGYENTAVGFDALFYNTSGLFNTATGYLALFNNTTGHANTATGVEALQQNTIGAYNTATGFDALLSNTTGGSNTATGLDALLSNTTGGSNTATGCGALFQNISGACNTATGCGTLYFNTTGVDNTATGVSALHTNSTGVDNTATGFDALYDNISGGYNTALGYKAGFDLTIGTNNIVIGYMAGFNLATGSNNIDIGNSAVGLGGESNTIRIGTVGTQAKAFIAGIYNVNEGGTILPVYINSAGQLGTMSSSCLLKKDTQPMDNASQALLALKPVTFRYKKNIDPKGAPQFGLVAEEVEKVNPDLVVCDAEGKVFTVRYEAVNAMLLNEFLKEHRKVQEQESSINQLKSTVAKQQKDFQAAMAQLTATLKEQALQIQRVNEQLATGKPDQRLAGNN